MCASYNLLGKLLNPYHLHVYMKLCMYLFYTVPACMYITRPRCLHTTPSHSALKGLSHEIDFENVDENGQILALVRAAAGF
jgi:hypothetical protein